ncbi:MAG: PEP-CTERM sorting domain-containing protein, partial [Verrucomicrobia bacterium]|nr:PEP-CTERM sorting domain-containing protein [Verrucomicrobiota bacterium]
VWIASGFGLSAIAAGIAGVYALAIVGGNTGAPPAYDGDDGFLVRASLDSGGTWQNLLAFEAIAGDDGVNEFMRQDADFDGIGDAGGFQPSGAFTAFSGLPITGTTNNLLVQVIFNSNDGNGEMAIDNFRINGTAVPEPTALSLVGMFGAGLLLRRRRRS